MLVPQLQDKVRISVLIWLVRNTPLEPSQDSENESNFGLRRVLLELNAKPMDRNIFRCTGMPKEKKGDIKIHSEK